MAQPKRLAVALITPDSSVYQGEADMVVVPAWDGQLGILRGHAPLMALLGIGQMRVMLDGNEQTFHIDGGFLQVADDTVNVLSERAEAL